MRRVLTLGLAAIAAALTVPSFATAEAFVCPELDHIASAGELAEIRSLLPSDIDFDAPGQLESAVFELNAKGVAPATAVDSLVAIYCAEIAADQSLSGAQKVERVQTFARSTAELVYSGVR